MMFLDEGTSSLDIFTEQRVTQAIGALSLTRLIVAHRPETINAATRVLVVDKGGLREGPYAMQQVEQAA